MINIPVLVALIIVLQSGFPMNKDLDISEIYKLEMIKMASTFYMREVLNDVGASYNRAYLKIMLEFVMVLTLILIIYDPFSIVINYYSK